jgi:hypothetical protein
MSPIPINLATEDELSEHILHRLLTETGKFAVGTRYRRGGNGYLKRTINGWNKAAAGVPFLVLTDLDQYACPSALLSSWLPVPRHANLLFRIAVREVESWLLADQVNLARFFGIAQSSIPARPDELPDPKQKLIDLARKSRNRRLREDIVPRKGSTAKQGPDYNVRLEEFVNGIWNPRTAAESSPSLHRAILKIERFHPIWPEA